MSKQRGTHEAGAHRAGTPGHGQAPRVGDGRHGGRSPRLGEVRQTDARGRVLRALTRVLWPTR